MNAITKPEPPEHAWEKPVNGHWYADPLWLAEVTVRRLDEVFRQRRGEKPKY